MAEEVASPKSPASPTGHGLRRAQTVDESAQFRRRPSTSRSSMNNDAQNLGPGRRRSSNLSDYSLNEIRKQFQSSTDDLLLPRPSSKSHGEHPRPSNWHSAPLAFALLPAIGGMLFQNGSAVVTDIILLGLAAIFLNWSVRTPWDWYYSAQTIRKQEEYNQDTIIEEESGDEHNVEASRTPLDDLPEGGPVNEQETKQARRLPAHEKASNELYLHELFALFSCFLFPLVGAYLLHSIRGYLSRPSEGLVSNYNLTIFLLASELRPVSHLFKLIQARTLHLQRVVHSNPYDSIDRASMGDVKDLVRRLEDLEARALVTQSTLASGVSEPIMNGKQTVMVTAEVRRTLQPELDALNRAVRRYEKRATLQTMQTESRLLDLEARLADAISLAAAAAQNGQRQRYGLWSMLVEWIASAIVLPVHALGALASLPFKAIVGLIGFAKTAIIGKSPERSRKIANGKPASHGRIGAERLQGKGIKR